MMIVRTCLIICVFSLLSALSVIHADSAFADERAGDIEMGKADGSTENCRSAHPGRLVAVIVPCIRDVLEETATSMTAAFDDITMPGTYALITLVLTFFGVKVLMAEGDVKKDATMLLFKIGFVMAFSQNLGGFIPSMYGMTADAAQIVTGALAGALSSVTCNVADFPGEAPWNQIDCMMGSLFGFAPGALIGSSIFGLMGASLWSGEMGVTLFMAGIAGLFFMFRLMIRCVYTYLMAVIVMTFLIIISPLMIPLVLFSATFEYFEHWLRSLLSTMLQPLFVLGYLALAVLILDKMLYDSDFGILTLLPPDEIEAMWGGNNNTNAASVVNNPGAFWQKNFGVSEDNLKKSFAIVESNAQFSGAASVMPWTELYRYDFKGEGVSKVNKIFFAMMALALMAYLLDLVLGTIAQMASFVLGGGFALSRLAGEESILEKKVSDMQTGMKNNWLSSNGELRQGMDQGGAAGVGAMMGGIPAAIQGMIGVRK